jgi:prepilin-type N-terminal cleavage/methylation domain-containing protein
MGSKTTSIDHPRRRAQAGMTLVELLVAAAVGGVLLTAILSVIFFSARSYAALTNYVDLDNTSRNALDVMTLDIRQADRLVSGSTNRLVFQHTNATNGSIFSITYTYNPTTRELVRQVQNGTRTVLLEECDRLNFSVFQRNPQNGIYDYYPTGDPATAKLIQLDWVCSRQIMRQAVNTESVQSAKVVIRKQDQI